MKYSGNMNVFTYNYLSYPMKSIIVILLIILVYDLSGLKKRESKVGTHTVIRGNKTRYDL